MATLSIQKPAPIACLTINGVIDFVGPWPLAQLRKKKIAHKQNVELHKHRHLHGVDYCQKCKCATLEPYLFIYEKTDYWKCQCGHINFIAK